MIIWSISRHIAGVTMKVKDKFLIFLAIELVLCGIIYLIISIADRIFLWKELWPLFAIASGIALIVSGLIIKKKITPSYFVPALVLLGMGLFFMIFSLDLLPFGFWDFVKRWWPCIPALCIGILLGMFVFNKETSKKEESGE